MDVLGTGGAGAEGYQAKVGEEEHNLSPVEFCPLSPVSNAVRDSQTRPFSPRTTYR